MFLLTTWILVFIIATCFIASKVATSKNWVTISILLSVVCTFVFVVGVFFIIGFPPH